MSKIESVQPTFSTVIPCYNEENYVGKLLGDLVRQTAQPKEVIVADSRSSDRTIEVAKRFQGKLPLQLATSEIRAPGATRNAGAEQAAGEYLVFIDADMRLPNTTFEQLAQTTKDSKVDFVTPLFSTPGHHIVDQLAVKLINADIRHGLTARDHIPGIGGFMCVRRALHETLHGFHTLPKGDDIDYLERLKQLNISYKVLDDLVIETSNRRLVEDGRFVSALNFIPQRSRVGKHIVYPILKGLGKEKKYGGF